MELKQTTTRTLFVVAEWKKYQSIVMDQPHLFSAIATPFLVPSHRLGTTAEVL